MTIETSSVGVTRKDTDENGREEPNFQKRPACAVFAVGLAGAGAVAVFVTENGVGSAALLAIGSYFIIATFIGRFPKLKVGDHEIDPSDWNRVKDTVKKTEKEVETLSKRVERVFLASMDADMALNLRKLSNEDFGEYFMHAPLERQLRHLRDLGYIEVNCAISEIPNEGENLSQHVIATKTGRDFINLRDEARRAAKTESPEPDSAPPS
ncbi:hypothetical protein ACFWVM_05480 [Nocardia fluminea]|uniref:hypothetical protein n=1 Tax=Nocardia fluminea TaxID=134984 RepID=UPI003647ADD0